MICPTYKTLSDTGRRAMISYNKNITCPPSNAGIGKIFIKAKTKLSIAVKVQKFNQFQLLPNICAIPIGPANDLVGSVLPVATLPRALALAPINPNERETPKLMDLPRPYLITFSWYSKP